MFVFVKGGNVQALGLTRDAVEDLSGARCLDRAFGNSNDSVRATFKKAASNRALFAGGKGSGGLLGKNTGRRQYGENRVAQDICLGRPG